MIQKSFRLWSNVELGVVIDEKDEVGVIDEPLAGVVERVTSVDLSSTSGFHDTRDFGENGLRVIYFI